MRVKHTRVAKGKVLLLFTELESLVTNCDNNDLRLRQQLNLAPCPMRGEKYP